MDSLTQSDQQATASTVLPDSERCCERGSGRRCYRRAIGAIGMLRYCGPCFAALAGWRANDERLHQPTPIVLRDGLREIGEAMWVPLQRQKAEAR